MKYGRKKTCVRESLEGKWLYSPEVHVFNYSHLVSHSDGYIFTGQGIYMNIQVYNYTNSLFEFAQQINYKHILLFFFTQALGKSIHRQKIS